MKKNDAAYPSNIDDVSKYQLNQFGITKFEYACIEFMKASICANNQTPPYYVDIDLAEANAKAAILYANALFERLAKEEKVGE